MSVASWPALMHRVFALDILACSRCGDRTLSPAYRTPSPSSPRPPSPLSEARAGPATRLGRDRVDSPLAQPLEASLSPPCIRALTASPRRGQITGGPADAPLQVRRRVHGGGETAPTPAAPGKVALIFPMRLCAVVARLLHLRNELDLNQLCWQHQSGRYHNRTCHFGPFRPIRFFPNRASRGERCIHVCDVDGLPLPRHPA